MVIFRNPRQIKSFKNRIIKAISKLTPSTVPTKPVTKHVSCFFIRCNTQETPELFDILLLRVTDFLRYLYSLTVFSSIIRIIEPPVKLIWIQPFEKYISLFRGDSHVYFPVHNCMHVHTREASASERLTGTKRLGRKCRVRKSVAAPVNRRWIWGHLI